LYEQAHGPIPKDEDGRSYEIHHIDGNRNNNELSNLRCVSIQEHYDIHFAQGDWAACHRIAAKMKLSTELLSELSSKTQLERVRNGTHPLQGGHIHRQMAKEGRHPAQIRSSLGINLFQDPEWKRQNALKLVEEGRHSSQKKKLCPGCGKQISILGYKRWGHGPECMKRKEEHE